MSASYLALLTTAAQLVVPAPPVQYDPATRTGVVTGGAVREAFGWDRRTLAARAPGVEFDHDFWTDDTYSATCGDRTYALVHHREFGRYELSGGVTGKGYGSPDFRITGAYAGISGTSVAPRTGQPCPARPGTTISRLRLTATATGWSLSATSGDVSRRLLAGR